MAKALMKLADIDAARVQQDAARLEQDKVTILVLCEMFSKLLSGRLA